MYILETNSFKYYLGERLLFKLLLFKLPALKLHTKSRIGLIGLNGSGKTTLLELLAGIRPIPAAAKIICKTTMTILPQLKERLSKSGGETTQAYILQALKQQSAATLKSISPKASSRPWISVRIVKYSPSLTRPMATPATGALIGTPASIKDRVLAQTLPIEEEPLDSRVSETRRIAYGNSSSEGMTAGLRKFLITRSGMQGQIIILVTLF